MEVNVSNKILDDDGKFFQDPVQLLGENKSFPQN